MKRDHRSIVGGFILGLVAVGGLSCSSGSKLNPVEGQVFHQDKPLAGALVTFHPKGSTGVNAVPSTGLTKEDGKFTLTTGAKEGAPAGEYVVTIICSQLPTSGKKEISTGGMDTEDVLKGAYADRNTSKITVTIKDGPNNLEPFKLK